MSVQWLLRDLHWTHWMIQVVKPGVCNPLEWLVGWSMVLIEPQSNPASCIILLD